MSGYEQELTGYCVNVVVEMKTAAGHVLQYSFNNINMIIIINIIYFKQDVHVNYIFNIWIVPPSVHDIIIICKYDVIVVVLIVI